MDDAPAIDRVSNSYQPIPSRRTAARRPAEDSVVSGSHSKVRWHYQEPLRIESTRGTAPAAE